MPPPNRLSRGARALVIAAAFACAVAPARAQLKAGFENLARLNPAAAIQNLTPCLIAAMRSGDKAQAARDLALIGHGFGLDGNIASYLACAKLARQLAPDDPAMVAFNIQALIRASMAKEAGELVAQYKPLAEKHAYLARVCSDYFRLVGEGKEADEYLHKALALNPNDPIPYALLARNSAKTPQETANYFKQAAQHAEPGSFRREMLLWSGERAVAKPTATNTEHLDKAAATLPDEPQWRGSRAFFLLAQGKQQEALKYFIEATQTPRLSLKAHAQLATWCAYNNRPKLAMQAADRVVELAPYLPESYLARAHVERQLGNLKGAEDDYKQSITVNPHFSLGYEALRDFPAYKDGKQAQWLAKQWTDNCAEKADAWLFAAERQRLEKNFAAAIELYDRSAERLVHSNKPPEKTQLTWCRIDAGKGTCAYRLSKFDIALQCARAFNQRKPSDGADFMRVRPAKIDFSKIPSGSKAELAAEHGLMADMLYECSELDDCIKEYKKAIALQDNPDWHRGLLKAYIDKKDFGAAATEDLVVSNNTVTKDLPSALDKLRKQFQR